jgi:hypothetical protein
MIFMCSLMSATLLSFSHVRLVKRQRRRDVKCCKGR